MVKKGQSYVNIVNECLLGVKLYFLDKFSRPVPTTTPGIEHACVRYLPLLQRIQHLGAAVEHNDVILTNPMTSY